MKKKLFSVLICAVMVVTMLSACGSNPAEESVAEESVAEESVAEEPVAEEPVAEEAIGSKIVIGCTLQNMSEEFMTMLKGAMEIQLKEYDNVELVVNDAEGKPDKQAAQVDSFVAQGVGAIIISPVDADALTPSVKAAIDAGVPVITCSADIAEEVGQVWVGSENESGGETQMKYVAEQLGGEGNVAILRGPLGAFAEQGRFAGYEAVLNQEAGLEVVFDQTANWQREEAMALVENWLTTGTKIDAIVCQNDGMALGALEAVQAAGKKGEINITGIDAIEDALNSIKDGGMDATCFQDAIGQGKGALEMAVRAANGETVERNNIPFELVTKENVEEYYSRIKLPE